MYQAKQAINRVNAIKLPDGQGTQAGGETMKELCRVHFPDLMLIDDSNNERDQQDLDVCKRTTNR
jgi:hypothetical protein